MTRPGGGRGRPPGPRPQARGPFPERKPPDRSRGPPRAHAHSKESDGDRLVYGRHAVEAVLKHQPGRGEKLLVQERTSAVALEALAKSAGIATSTVDADALGALVGASVAHQGCVLRCAPYPYTSVDALDDAPSLSLVLDGVEDPRNLGAAARAGYALGATLLVVPADRAAGCTASAFKASAGALARIEVARETNLRRALDRLKEKGAWVVGAEADGKEAPWDVDLKGPIALVIGGEDSGLRRLTREACDHIVRIPMPAPDMSLNAAGAATVLLYEVLRQRRSR